MTEKNSEYEIIAKAFTDARSNNLEIRDYPGRLPETLHDAYSIQDLAISYWPEKLAGWKVGGINERDTKLYKSKKLIGPIFDNQIFETNGSKIEMPIFEKGFAAVEAEIVFILKKDAPKDKTHWSLEDAKSMILEARTGVEIASSPFKKINDLGPLVTISDFGNNYGLILGEPIQDWESFETDKWIVETILDGESLGTKSSADAGGPFTSLQYCLQKAAERGMPLQKGMAISTGAITGVHQAYAGQDSVVKFAGTADIRLKLVPKG